MGILRSRRPAARPGLLQIGVAVCALVACLWAIADLHAKQARPVAVPQAAAVSPAESDVPAKADVRVVR